MCTRRLLGLLCGLLPGLIAAGVAGTVQAQDWPTRTVRIVIASVAGSSPDVLARIIAERLQPALGQPVIVENKAGAGGIVGIDSVAKAAPDGYTLCVGHDGTMAINTTVYKSLPYDPAKDFAAIAPLALNELVLIAHPSTGVKTLADFIAYAKAKPGQRNYASAGVGTPNHLFMEILAREAGIAMVHVPYKGGAAGVADVVGGQVEFMLAGIAPALPHIKAGKLTAVAMIQPMRSKVLPDVPAVAETIPGFGLKTWFGMFAPAGTRPEVVARLNREVRAILARPDIVEKIAGAGMVVETGEAAALADMVAKDLERYRQLAREIKLEPL